MRNFLSFCEFYAVIDKKLPFVVLHGNLLFNMEQSTFYKKRGTYAVSKAQKKSLA